MKFLKGLLYLVLILAVVFVLANAFGSGEKAIERSVTINASLDKVYSQVANFERWKHWDAWYNKDTSQTRELHGEMGEEGYGYSWESDNEDVGSGTMDFTKYEEMSRIDYHLEFEGMGGSDGYFTFAEEDGATTVTWAFISKMPFFYRFMNYMMDGMLGPDLEKGLNNLKELVENSSDEELGITPPQTPITMGSIHGTSYAMIRETLSIKNDMDGFFAPAYGRLHGYITENSQTIMGPACALYYTWDTLNDQTDVAAAFPLSEPVSEEGKEIQIAAGKAMLYSNHITYKMVGAYNMENFGAAHEALGAYLEENGKTATSPVVEEYVKGPNDQIPPEEYVTNITYYFE